MLHGLACHCWSRYRERTGKVAGKMNITTDATGTDGATTGSYQKVRVTQYYVRSAVADEIMFLVEKYRALPAFIRW